jgi:hypothetical protein
MTKHEIERESRCVRLGRAMGPGLYAISVLTGAPLLQRAAMSAAYGTSDSPARRKRRQPQKVTR